jgi:hypothetical protein
MLVTLAAPITERSTLGTATTVDPLLTKNTISSGIEAMVGASRQP